ncbi:MAG TPA: ABC transporter substrate-binding protein [Tepidisphaeraceae bacterium]|jgi:NitT/TauT family transport system substrate-binding protein
MRSMLNACRVLFSAAVLGPVLGLATVAPAATLKIAYSDWPGWSALDVTKEKGFFKEAGVDVELVWMEYLPSMEALAAGKVDAVTCTNGDAMVTGATGKPSKCIVLTDYSNGNDMIVGKPGINSIKDLKGKKIGLELNLVEHLLLLKGLEANGMTEADVTITNVPTNDTPQALASGGVDAIGAWYPIAGQAIKQVAGAKPLFTSADAKGLIYDGIFVAPESLAKNRADWVKVVEAYIKTVEFIKNPATRDEAVKIMAAHVQVNPADYAKNMGGTYFLNLEDNLKHFTKGDGLDSVYGSSKVANAFNVKNNVYKDSQPVDAYFDPSLLKEVAAKAKK